MELNTIDPTYPYVRQHGATNSLQPGASSLGQRLGASTPFVSEGRAVSERRTDSMAPQAGVSVSSQSGSYCGRSADGRLGPVDPNDPRGRTSSDLPPLRPIVNAGTVHFELSDSSRDEYSEPESEGGSQPPMRPPTPAPPQMQTASRPPPTRFVSAARRQATDGQPLLDARPTPQTVELVHCADCKTLIIKAQRPDDYGLFQNRCEHCDDRSALDHFLEYRSFLLILQDMYGNDFAVDEHELPT